MKITLDDNGYNQLKNHLSQMEVLADKADFGLVSIQAMLRSDRTEHFNSLAMVSARATQNSEIEELGIKYYRTPISDVIYPRTEITLPQQTEDMDCWQAFIDQVQSDCGVVADDLLYTWNEDVQGPSTLISEATVKDLWEPEDDYTIIHLLTADGLITHHMTQPSFLYMGQTTLHVYPPKAG